MVELVSGLNSEVEGALGGLRRAQSGESPVRTGLVLHPSSSSSSCLVLNSSPGFLQFYDTATGVLSQEARLSALWWPSYEFVCLSVSLYVCLAGCRGAELCVSYR